MGQDKAVIQEFLRGYNESLGTTYAVIRWPDELDRKEQALDAIAQDGGGQMLAIEHTLIQPFVGEKDDAQRLLTVIAPLEADCALRIPGKSIDVSVPVGAIPKGWDWKEVGAKVIDWFRDTRVSFPEGQSIHKLPGVGFELTLRIDKGDSPYPQGRVYVMRSGMPEDFTSVVRKALADKLPKLAQAAAGRRILLFEMDNLPRSATEVTDALEALKGEFPELGRIDEVWCPLTAAREAERRYIITRVWPRSEGEWPRIGVSI